MRKTLPLTLTAAAAAALIVPVAATASTPSSPSAHSTVRWGDCPSDVTLPGVPAHLQPELECATIRVPLDYDRPHGRQISLAISRLPSTDAAHRRGILLTNPGGPGSSGLSYPAALVVAGLPKSVQRSYDIIGIDPRGVGHSTPVTCDFTPAQLARSAFPDYAHTSADVVRESRYARTIAKQCATSATSYLLPHLTTANTARDMDRVRAALGEPKASYLGSSYGSYLGAVYATLFPRTSDRVVIDSILGPGGYDFTATRLFALGLHDRFPDFAAFVVAHPEYGLGRTQHQVKATFFRLVAKLDKAPINGFNGDQLRFFTFSFLYGDATFPNVAKLWQAVDTGAATLPLPAGGEGDDPDNAMSARAAVVCGDSRWPTAVSTYEWTATIDRILLPMLGGSTGNITPCAYWSHPADMEPRVRITDHGTSNLLMVQNRRDPGTPLAGALQMRSALGKRAVMVTADAGGHGVYPFVHNTCADDVTTRFLTTGVRPNHDLACPANPSQS